MERSIITLLTNTKRAFFSIVTLFSTLATAQEAIELSSLDGSNGFVIRGVTAYDESGWSVSSAGDVNGDGVDDLIIGARKADAMGNEDSGESYVVFGNAGGFPQELNLAALDGTNGFVLNGFGVASYSGSSVSSAGDVNGDGTDDLIVGAPKADRLGKPDAGIGFVVFGSDAGFPAALNLSTLDGTNGFVLIGSDAGDQAGKSVSGAGDVNGDGIDDLIIGAYRADSNGNEDAGSSYVVFGRDTVVTDSDGDGIADDADNCRLVANADQRDTNADLIGNACDADVTGDCIVSFGDLAELKAAFFPRPYDPDVDFDGNGAVDFSDLATMKATFFNGPDPGPGPGAPGNACE